MKPRFRSAAATIVIVLVSFAQFVRGGISIHPAKPAYLISFRSSESTTDLAKFATTLINLRLLTVHEVRVSSESAPPTCAAPGKEDQTRMQSQANQSAQVQNSTPEGTSLFFTVSGSLNKDADQTNGYSITYAVRKFDKCQETVVTRDTRRFELDDALAALNNVSEEIASHLADAASDKIPVKLQSSDVQLQSYLEVAFNDSPVFRAVNGPATYVVQGSHEPPNSSDIIFKISGNGIPPAIEKAPHVERARSASSANLQAAEFALNLLTDIDARRSVGVNGDYRALRADELWKKAQSIGCSAESCGNPTAVVALLRDRIAEMPASANEMLAYAYLKLERPREAAVAFDRVLEQTPSGLDARQQLLIESARSWLAASQPQQAFARWQELSRLEVAAGKQTADTAIGLAHTAAAVGQTTESWSTLVAARSRFPDDQRVISEWEELLGSLPAGPLELACNTSRKQLNDDAFTGMCVYALARANGHSSDALKQYEDARVILEKHMPNSQVLANVLYDFAQNLDWSRQRPQALEYASAALEIRKKVDGETSARAAESYYQLGLLLSWDFQYPKSEENLAAALSIRKSEDDNLAIANTEMALAYVLQNEKGKFAAAEKNYRDALAIYEDLNNQWNVATACLELADLLDDRLDRFHDAEALRRRALQIYSSLNASDSYRANVLSSLAGTLADEGKFSEAIKDANDALTIRQKVLGPKSPYVAQSYGRLGIAYLYAGKFDLAYQQYALSLKLRTAIDDPSEISAISTDEFNLAMSAEYRGLYEESEAHYRKSLELDKNVSTDFDVAYRSIRLANVLTLEGRYREADGLLSANARIVKATYAPEHLRYTIALGTEANLLATMGKYPEALELAKQALDLRKSQEKESEWRLSTYLLRVGRVLSAEGNHSEAVPYYERVVKIWSALSVPDHPDVAEASLGLGLAAGTSGRYEDMATNCNHALSIAEKGLDPKHPELAAIHGCLADYYAKGKQDISKALAEQSQAVKILKNAYSRPHPDLSRALDRYADLLEQAGKETEAQAQRSRASEINKAHAAQEAKPKLTAVTQ